MSSHIVYENDFYTIRCLENGPSPVSTPAKAAIVEAMQRAGASLGFAGHLFVSIIPGEAIVTEDGAGFGLYHQGLQHIAIAGGGPPDEWDGSESEWLQELQVSTVHEVCHYIQDIEGRLDGSADNEEEAESTAYRVLRFDRPVSSIPQRQRPGLGERLVQWLLPRRR